MEAKIPLADSRFRKRIAALGWVIFSLTLVYVYALPHFMYQEAFILVDGRIEALLAGLSLLYVVVLKARAVPFLVMQLLAVREFYESPGLCLMAAVVSLAIAVTPLGWLGDFGDFGIGIDEGGDDQDGMEF